MKQVFNGIIICWRNGYASDVIFILKNGKFEYPLAEDLQYISGKQVTARYYISDTFKSKEELDINLIKKISWNIKAEYSDVYSELTGHLWTNENLIIWWHDLLKELRTYIWRYVYLEIETFKKNG